MTDGPAGAVERTAHAEPAELGAPDRKTRDAGLILPLAGMVALMPPAGQILAVEGVVFGMPVVVFYVFAVWAFLILLAWRLARRFAQDRPAGGGPRAGRR